MAEEKVTKMVLTVDLKCSKCYKKVKKLLCKFPEIRDQEYDEKANKVTIKVVSCSPEKIKDKLYCKSCGCITSIEIIPPKPDKPPPPPKKDDKKEPEKPKDEPVKVSVDVQVEGFFYCKWCGGRPWGPCSCGGRGPCSCGGRGPCSCGGQGPRFCGGRGQCDPCYGGHDCDSWCTYGSGCEKTQPGCSIM